MPDDQPRCGCCGEPIDPFEALVSDLEDAAEGHEEGYVVGALCLMLGGILASAKAGAERRALRRVMGELIAEATKLRAEEEAEAAPAAPGLH